ncbi:MAG TPA: sulfatase [Thermoanaerobaculia bacterium]|nr:sulfatase [Thermoanaerobaculia bacterium]
MRANLLCSALLPALFAAACSPAGSPEPPAGPPPSILVYLVDTLRLDAPSIYGGPDGVSPHLEALAGESAVFTRATAQSSWTRTAVASLFTGLLPPSHGVYDKDDALPEGLPTLSERLGSRGYETVAFVTNPNIDRRFGMGRGFDWYRMIRRKGNDATVAEEFFAWLDAREPERPFFAYLHTVEPHAPYQPGPPHRERWAPGISGDVGTRAHLRRLHRSLEPVTAALERDLRALYAGEVAASDAALGDVMAGLHARGLWDELVVVFLSDHGEEFYEHGRLGHGKNLYTETLDIPLLLRVPGLGQGRRIETPVQHVDLTATLLAIAGVRDAETEGEDLVPLLAAAGPPRDRGLVSFLRLDGVEAAAVTTGRWRWIEESRGGGPATHALYDRWSDPAERVDVAADHPRQASRLRAVLRAARFRNPRNAPAPAARLDPETTEHLRALGYLD